VTRPSALRAGGRALVRLFPAAADGETIRSGLRLEHPRGVLVLNGGTDELSPTVAPRLRLLLQEGLAAVARERRLTVVTGGTDAGIFRLFGAGFADGATAPCIGVAPAELVGRPGDEEIAGSEGRVPLEPHHTHFALVEGDRWGDETGAIVSLVDALAADAPALVVLAGGGSIAKQEMLGHVRAGREVVVLAGSGRLADEIADVVTGRRPAGDPELAEIVGGRVTLLGAQQPPSALADLVRARLVRRRRRPRLRDVPLFHQLPRLRWRTAAEEPFVSQRLLARSPDQRPEIELLERELVPRFRELDRASLRTQNAFRLGQLSLIVGSAAASALGAAQAALGGGVVALAVPEALVAGVLAGLLAYVGRRNAQREYFTERLKAERLRAEYFIFLAGAGDYAAEEDHVRAALLRRRIRTIASHEEQA
jgi:hypothetical protein